MSKRIKKPGGWVRSQYRVEATITILNYPKAIESKQDRDYLPCFDSIWEGLCQHQFNWQHQRIGVIIYSILWKTLRSWIIGNAIIGAIKGLVCPISGECQPGWDRNRRSLVTILPKLYLDELGRMQCEFSLVSIRKIVDIWGDMPTILAFSFLW